MPGRNDPCPCGSGKKYKKCCLRKELQQQADAHAAVEETTPALVAVAEEERDVLEEQRDEWFELFIDAPYEEKWALVDQVLSDTQELLDGEMLFEIGDALMARVVEHNDLDRFEQLLDTLESARPDAFAAEIAYFADWRFDVALLRSDWERADQLFLEAASLIRKDGDLFHEMVTALQYHGRLDGLIAGMRKAFPYLGKDWLVEDFAEKLAGYEIVNLLAQNSGLTAEDPVLQERLEPLDIEFDPDVLNQRLEYHSGRRVPEWTPDDFVPSFSAELNGDRAVRNLGMLLHAWAYYLHDGEGLTSSKAEMVRTLLFDYLIWRYGDDLEEIKAEYNRRPKRGEPILYPDHATLDPYLRELVGFMNSGVYEASALMETLPSWLRFLQKHDLIDDEHRAKVEQQLRSLYGNLLKFIEASSYDPALVENLRAAYGKSG